LMIGRDLPFSGHREPIIRFLFRQSLAVWGVNGFARVRVP